VVEFTIPAGINHGDTLRISGKGEAIPDGPSGDLFVQMFVEPHKDFSRKDYDLLITQEITVSEAILGATREIKMLDDTKIEIKIPNGTQSGAILRVSGRGIAGRGNLMVTIKIHIPKRLSKAAKSALEVLQAEGY
jgi:molecular chaperone DnaJ